MLYMYVFVTKPSFSASHVESFLDVLQMFCKTVNVIAFRMKIIGIWLTKLIQEFLRYPKKELTYDVLFRF